MNASEMIVRGLEKWEYINNPENHIDYESKGFDAPDAVIASQLKGDFFSIYINCTINGYAIKISMTPYHFAKTAYPDTMSLYSYITTKTDDIVNVNQFCHTTGWNSSYNRFRVTNYMDLYQLQRKIETLLKKFKENAVNNSANRDGFENKVRELTAGIDPSLVKIDGDDRLFKIGADGVFVATIKSHNNGLRYTIDFPSMNEDEMLAVLEGVKRLVLLKKMKEV